MRRDAGTTRTGAAFRRERMSDVLFNVGCTGYGDDTVHGTTTLVGPDGAPPLLHELVGVLNTFDGLLMYKRAYLVHMTYKIGKYTELLEQARLDVERHVDVLRIKTPELKRVAGVDGAHDNWNIFESISEQYREATDRAATFEALQTRARQRLAGTMAVDELRPNDAACYLRDDLVRTLRRLSNFASQAHIVVKVVEIVGSFIKDPRLFRTKLMNFMLMGGAGTGKTTLASAIGAVFAKAGIFVGDRLIEAGRAELVGQYEGHTVARTRNFLINHLDAGVVFIDEAYAITPWQQGKPEGYGAEAATAMVEFMTRFPGLYCLIVAGYEKEMSRYFLPTNEGLSRRFPNKYVLGSMAPSDMIVVFRRALLHAQGADVPDGRDTPLGSTGYFSKEAWTYLHDLVAVSTQGDVVDIEEHDQATRRTYARVRTFRPHWEYLFALFSNQAGSMTNLADEAVTVLMGTISYDEVIALQRKRHGNTAVPRPAILEQPVSVMRHIVVQAILKSSLSDAPHFLAQLQHVERIMRTGTPLTG